MRRLAGIIALLLLAGRVPAQGPARQLIDANPAVVTANGSSTWSFAPLGADVAFLAFDGRHGTEMWRSDGTPAGTRLVLDIAPGRIDGVETGFGGGVFQPLGAGLAFVGNSGDVFQPDSEPWFSDGTAAGTARIVDLLPGVLGSRPTMKSAAGLVFFSVDAAAAFGGNIEPWRTDGTAAGTISLGELEPGPTGSYPRGFTPMGASCIFIASTSAFGYEPHVSDGTPGGTRLLLDVNPGPPGSDAEQFFHDGALTWFSAATAAGDEPWVTDGSAAGTRMVADATPGIGSTNPRSFVSMGGVTYFIGSSPRSTTALWRSDGTPAGTSVVMDTGASGAWGITGALHVLGSRLIFGATQEGPPADIGDEPWASDGTTAGTIPLHVHPVGQPGLGPEGMVAAGDHVFFWGDDGVVGREPWRTDGTPAGTALIIDIAPGLATSVQDGRPGTGTHVNGRTWFQACTTEFGCEPWSSDGTLAGTLMAADIHPETTDSGPRPIANVEGRALLAIHDGVNGQEPWVSDGSTAGTRLLADIVTGLGSSRPTGLGLHRGRFWFFAGEGAWRTDAIAEATPSLDRFFSAGDITLSVSTPRGLIAPLGGPPGVPAHVLSEPGLTVELPPECRTPYQAVILGRAGGLVALSGAADRTGRELVMTDGTIAGTSMIGELPGWDGRETTWGIELGDRLILDGADELGAGTFITDGITNGGVPTRLSDALPYPNPRLLDTAWRLGAGTDDWIAFAAEDDAAGIEPWVTDGTPAGTRPLGDLYPGPGSSAPSWLTRMGSDVLFVASDLAGGTELWISDGTPAGTRPLVDIEPGAGSSWPRDLVAISPNGPLVFTAHRSDTGRELWWTDGTPAGTRMLDEIVVGPDDIDPIRLLSFGRHVVFDGLDDAGSEPWILDVPWAPEVGNCRNGDDDDGDGLTDCADSDCAATPACDQDGDGASDADDCAPTDPGARAIPAEVRDVIVAKDIAGSVSVSWTDAAAAAGSATRHEIALDSIAALHLRRVADAPCIALGVGAPAWGGDPGGSWYALVRASNACGPGQASGWGVDSAGVQRPACP